MIYRSWAYSMAAVPVLTGMVAVAHLDAQSLAERRVIDSVMISLPNAKVPTRFGTANMKTCELLSTPMQHVCKGLIWASAGGFIPMGDHQSIDPHNIRRNLDTLTYCSGKLRSGDAAAAGRTEFWNATLTTPVWGAAYYGAALIQLDSKHRFDSTLVLLSLARRAGGVAAGILDLTEARTMYLKGEAAAGWKMLLAASRDTSTVSQVVLRSTVFRMIPTFLQHTWDSVPVGLRATWLAKQAAIKSLIARAIVPVFLDKCLDVRAKAYAEQKQGGVLVIPFAIEGGGLVSDTLSRKPLRAEYRYRLQVEAIRDEDGLTVVYDSLRATPLPAPINVVSTPQVDGPVQVLPGQPGVRFQGHTLAIWVLDKQYRLTAGVEISLPPGQYTVTMVVSQDSARRGFTKTLPPVTMPATIAGRLNASDLVLGWEDKGLLWHSPTRTVPLNPFGEWLPDSKVTLFTQLSGLTAGRDYQVSLQLFRFDGKSAVESKPVVSLTFSEPAPAETAEWYRELSTTKLATAQYCVVAEFAQGDQRLRLVDRLVITPSAGINTSGNGMLPAKYYTEKPELAEACAKLKN